MAEMYIGFNVQEAKNLKTNIKEQFDLIQGEIKNKWEPLQTTIHTEWVGPDANDFEKKFVSRVNKLYGQSKALADGAISLIDSLVSSWKKFQKSNVLTETENGGSSSAEETSSENVSTDESETNVNYASIGAIEAKPPTITDETNRGLKSQSSSETIKNSVYQYVVGVQNAVNGLFDTCTTNKAFFGENQTTALKTFIDKVSDAIGEVVTAVRDMYKALDQLTGSSTDNNYGKTELSFSTSVSEDAVSDVDEALSKVDTKWGIN